MEGGSDCDARTGGRGGSAARLAPGHQPCACPSGCSCPAAGRRFRLLLLAVATSFAPNGVPVFPRPCAYACSDIIPRIKAMIRALGPPPGQER